MRSSIRTAALVAAISGLLAVGCGDANDEAAAPATETEPPATQTDRVGITSLVKQSERLSREVGSAARRLGRDPASKAAAGRLQRAEDRARRLIRKAEKLDSDDPARTALAEANQATARAARELRRYAAAGSRPKLGSAHDELGRSERSLGRLADQLR